MNIKQLLQHYGTPTAARAELGYTLQSFRDWGKAGRIPLRAQGYIEFMSRGKLKADKTKKAGIASGIARRKQK